MLIFFSQMFVRGIAEIAEGLVAVERIQSFLESEEKSFNTLHSPSPPNSNGGKPNEVNALIK